MVSPTQIIAVWIVLALISASVARASFRYIVPHPRSVPKFGETLRALSIFPLILFLSAMSLINFSFAAFGTAFVALCYLLPANFLRIKTTPEVEGSSQARKLVLLLINPLVWLLVASLVDLQKAFFTGLGVPSIVFAWSSFLIQNWARYLRLWHELLHVSAFFPFVTLVIVPLNMLNLICL